jgi:tetratricopeptide (TPR) repeat protein
MSVDTAIQRHHSELARAAAAAMQKHYQETIDIVSDLLTSGIYEEIAAVDPERAKQFRAEARLMMATAMHYNDAHYEDILRVLNAALDSPPQLQKDVYFTLAVLHLSFDHVEEAKAAMNKALEIISQLRSSGTPDPDGSLAAQEQEAQHFLEQVEAEAKRKPRHS